MDREVAANAFLVIACGALVGARCLYVIANWTEFSGLRDIVSLRGGGYMAYGGFVGGLAAALFWFRKQGVSWLRYADAVSAPLAAGIVLTRSGCLSVWLRLWDDALFACANLARQVGHVPPVDGGHARRG